MKIAIIGTGNVGGALAKGLVNAKHEVVFGVRNPTENFKGKEVADELNIPANTIQEAVTKSEVIIVATPAQFAHEIAQQLGDVKDKVIIDTMNAVFMKPANYTNTSDAILDNCNCIDVVKCFNSTGFENMENPIYHGEGIDMFVAGNSTKGKAIATQLAKDIGFATCYDFGGNDKFYALEQFAFAWINLAILQKHGRNLAFKLIKR
ncbi:MAG: NAD(P)-binding domain-containing protein [Chitinophagales bacterium]